MLYLKEKLKAFLVHLLVSLCIMGLVAIMVFCVWYPREFSEMVPGFKLFSLIVLGEICLGPLLSFVIYNPKKARKELLIDYSCIILVQLSALGYGLVSVVKARPVFLVYVVDRLEVVTARELAPSDLGEASPEFQKFSFWGPRLICVTRPTDGQEKTELLFSGVEGRDIQHIPKYYRECKQGELQEKMLGYDLLVTLSAFNEDHIKDLNKGSLGWVPVVSRFGAWLALYPNKNIEDVKYFNISPFDFNTVVEGMND